MGKLPPDFAAGDVELSFAITHKLSLDIDRGLVMKTFTKTKTHKDIKTFAEQKEVIYRASFYISAETVTKYSVLNITS